MSREIKLEIEGVPVSWKAHGGYGKKSFNPRWKEREYVQAKIKEQYNESVLFCPVSLKAVFLVPIPKSMTEKKRTLAAKGHLRPIKRPDVSNYMKFLEDCLTGLVLQDDSLVVSSTAEKWYSHEPKTIVQILYDFSSEKIAS